MNIQETPPVTVRGSEVTLPKSKEELLGEITEKALGQQKKIDAQTMRAVEQLKKELQHKIDQECYHKSL
jgi:ElaB/YqjD/DUF883 family membrane-anchored ribosome-binding protein